MSHRRSSLVYITVIYFVVMMVTTQMALYILSYSDGEGSQKSKLKWN